MFAALFALLALGTPPEPFQVNAPTLDAGEVKAGPVLTRRFAFVNAGTEPLTVTDLKASCGCATPSLTQRTYRPGERGEIALEVNTLSQPVGPNRWSLTVSYEYGGRTGTAALQLTAKLSQGIDVHPAALTFHGHGDIKAAVWVRDPVKAPLTVVSATTSSPHLQVSQADLTNAVFQGFNVVEVRVTEDCPAGRHSGTVTITTDDRDCREIKVPVTIVREPKQQVSAAPSRASLVAGGSALVQLRDATGRAVTVEKTEPNHPALTCRWTAGPGNLATLRIGLDRAKWSGGELTGEVRVTANGHAIVIPVSVRAAE